MSHGKGRQRWRCHACNKWAYGSQARAEETMQGILETFGQEADRRLPTRAYPCPYNNGFHLTSTVERV